MRMERGARRVRDNASQDVTGNTGMGGKWKAKSYGWRRRMFVGWSRERSGADAIKE